MDGWMDGWKEGRKDREKDKIGLLAVDAACKIKN
jgi:hypothetical protein